METLKCIEKRRSVRNYLSKPVTKLQIEAMLNAARQAPSAGNIQPWKFIIIQDPEKIKELSEASLQQYWIQTAPLVIAVCCEHAKTEAQYGERGLKYAIMDCAIASENIMLTATDLGLATCYIAAFEDDMIRRALGIPDNVLPAGLITIGHADERTKSPLKYTIENVSYIERWGNRIADIMEWFGYYSQKWPKAITQAKKDIKHALGKI